MVVGEGLAGGSRLRGSPARGSEVAKLVGGLGRLGLHILSHGAWRGRAWSVNFPGDRDKALAEQPWSQSTIKHTVGELLVSSSGV